MPIQEEGKASVKPAAKVRPILKPSSTSGWDFTTVDQRQWIDIEIQESKDPYCFQLSKLNTRLLRHSQEVYREEDGGVPYGPVIDQCKKKSSDNTGYWSDEMKKHFVNAPHWSMCKWISVLAKGGGQEKRFQYCLNPNYPHQFLYLRAIQWHSGSTINPALKDNVLLPEWFTEYIYHVGNGKEWRSIVNHGLIPGRVSKQADKLCSSLLWIRWMIKMAKVKPCSTCQKQESRETKILGNPFRTRYFGAIWSSLNEEDCNFIKQDHTQLFSTTCLQSSLRKRYSWKPRISFIKGKEWF